MAKNETTPARTVESKQEHFKRLAEVRVNRIIEWSEKLGRLSNSALYEYSEADVEKIETACNEVLAAAIAKLKNGGKVEGAGFKL